MLLCAAQYRPGQSNGPKAQPQHNTGWDVGCTRRLASSNTGGRKGEGKEEGRGISKGAVGIEREDPSNHDQVLVKQQYQCASQCLCLRQRWIQVPMGNRQRIHQQPHSRCQAHSCRALYGSDRPRPTLHSTSSRSPNNAIQSRFPSP